MYKFIEVEAEEDEDYESDDYGDEEAEIPASHKAREKQYYDPSELQQRTKMPDLAEMEKKYEPMVRGDDEYDEIGEVMSGAED